MSKHAFVLLVPLLMAVAVQSAWAQKRRIGQAMPPAIHVTPRPESNRNLPPPPPVVPETSRPSTPSPFTDPSIFASHYTRSFSSRPSRFRRLSPLLPGYGYRAPFTADVAPAGAEALALDSSSDQREATGSLYLDVEPRTAQVYADGFYIGTVDDFRRAGVALSAGRHWIDLRAPGYEALTIPVDVSARSAGQPTRFRGSLNVLRPAPVSPFPPRGPETMYVIPGCYAGNRPPRESSLARGCNIARLHILTEPH